jgi:hypothetical protein
MTFTGSPGFTESRWYFRAQFLLKNPSTAGFLKAAASYSVADPDPIDTDQDPAFQFDTDPDLTV